MENLPARSKLRWRIRRFDVYTGLPKKIRIRHRNSKPDHNMAPRVKVEECP